MASTPNSWLRNLENEEACLEALEIYLWRKGRRCPYCKNDRGKEIGILNGLKRYQCNTCRNPRRQFNVFTGTPFSGTRIPKRKWFEAHWYIVRGIRPEVYAKKIGLANREARALEARIRNLDLEHGEKVLWAARRKFERKVKQLEESEEAMSLYNPYAKPMRRF